MLGNLHRAAALAIVATLLAAAAPPVFAGEPEIQKSFSIEAQPLATALSEFARQADLQILFRPDAVSGLRSERILGTYPVLATLERLLQGTGLRYEVLDERTVAVSQAPASPLADGGAMRTHLAQAETPRADTVGTKAVADQAVAIEEVVVTANRREELIQSVPVAITAFDAEQLRQQNIGSATDIMGKVPSLTVTSNGTQRNAEVVVIRGQGQTFLSSVGVVNYFAEVPLLQGGITANQGGPGTFFDLESLQVLRGPQGTLFGRNTTGGAVLLGPKKPTNELEGYAQVQFGNYNNREYEAALNVPVIEDRLLMRAAFKHVERDGFTKDVGPGPYGFSDVCVPNPGGCFANRSPGFAGKDYDDKDYWHGRIGITFRPTEHIENYLLGYYGDSRDNGNGAVITDIPTDTQNVAKIASNLAYLRPFNPARLFDSTISQQVLARQRQLGPRHVAMNVDQFSKLKTWGVIDTLSFQFTDALTLRNIASYQRMEQNFAWDQDGSILPILSSLPPFVAAGNPFGSVGDEAMITDSSQVTEELQLLGEVLDGNLDFAFGVYYSNQKPEGLQAAGSFNAGSLNPGLFYDVENRSRALYSQATLNLGTLSNALEKLSFTAGLRYTKDRIIGSRYASNYFVIPLVQNVELEYSEPTWTAGLDYQASDDALFYGKVTRGYKAGGFNFYGPRPLALTFRPEFVTSYELGAKTDLRLGNMPLRFNVDAYYVDYEDMQRGGADSYPNVRPDGTCPNATCLDQGASKFNAEGARIQGVEVESILRPIENLELSLGYAYTDAKFTSYIVDLAPDPLVRQIDSCNGPVAVPFPGQPSTSLDLSCIPFQYVPEHMANLGARYTMVLGEEVGSLAFGAVYSWVDRAFHGGAMTPNDDPLAWVGAYGTLNLSLDWSEVFGSRLDLRVWGTNVTDKLYRVMAAPGTRQASGFAHSVYGEPRMYGVSLRYRFGE
ncbi:MAG: TonB-dependent receptor [Gammaproteobacteria bacterium]|nr:TonB-dependent receptor [Gammaproteobacteria bacterium]